jgi:cytochrome c5
MDSTNSRQRSTHAPSTIPALALVAGLAAAAALPSFAADRSGAEVVKGQCARCHDAGTAGAPKPGDKGAWAPRMSRGIDALALSAVRGHGGMPPRGGKADLTDGEIRSAVLYLFDPSGATKPPAKAASAPSPSAAGLHRASAGGMDIYLGRLSAEQMRAFPAGSPEAKMHGGIPGGSGYWHVNVSVFDSASQAQVTGATVEFEYEQLGMGREKKSLEPAVVAGQTSYGAYVRLAPKATYNILVRVKKPGAPQAAEVRFQDKLN